MPDARGQWHLLTLGDSILWGQGLRDANKIVVRTAQSLSQAKGVTVNLHVYAHSGAWIWNQVVQPPHPDDPSMASLAQSGRLTLPGNDSTRDFIGERPLPEPYVWSQLHQASLDLAHLGVSPDVVLLDGGINNIGVFEIVNSTHDAAWMQRQVDALRGWMYELLLGVHGHFPAAHLVVTGYYPVFSNLSFALGADLASRTFIHAVTGLNAFGVLHPMQDLVALSRTFSQGIHANLSADVQRFNGQVGASVAAYAPPRFTAANAYAAPRCLLWQLNLNPLHFLEPMDDAVAEREAALGGAQGLERQVGLRCSAGHPNREGAERYHEAVVKALKALGVLP
ncbi:MAG: hypothetical protein ABIJ09_16270 [Pseudomonadota bacterium]